MTTAEAIKCLESAIDNIKEVRAKIDAINAICAASGDRLYTAFDVIRLVQKATSNEICGLGAEEASVAFEVERSIIAELVKEDEHENRDSN